MGLPFRIKKLKKWQESKVALYAALVTFLTYATVYAFRKPFTVGSFSQEAPVMGLPYKDLLVISQVLGYMFSKFYGVRFIAELRAVGRGRIILLLTGISWTALLLFALLPSPWNIVLLFANGFPLGMIWGVVFSYVEGRKATDFIGAALAVSFIFSSGFVKSVAKSLQLHFHIADQWLPFATGLVFLLPLLLFIRMLEQIPPPTEEEKKIQVPRTPMNRMERLSFFKQFGTGLVLLILVYVFLTLFRDIRDNFAADMWNELGFGNQPEIFTTTETPVTIVVLLLISCMMLVRNNFKAFMLTHSIIIAGFCIAGLSSFLFIQHVLSPFLWMTLVGLGLYIGYIPFNCILFDRMIAAFKQSGNAGFLMYLADSFGYFASVVVIISRTLVNRKVPWTFLYSNGVILLSVAGIVITLLAMRYFKRKYSYQI